MCVCTGETLGSALTVAAGWAGARPVVLQSGTGWCLGAGPPERVRNVGEMKSSRRQGPPGRRAHRCAALRRDTAGILRRFFYSAERESAASPGPALRCVGLRAWLWPGVGGAEPRERGEGRPRATAREELPSSWRLSDCQGRDSTKMCRGERGEGRQGSVPEVQLGPGGQVDGRAEPWRSRSPGRALAEPPRRGARTEGPSGVRSPRQRAAPPGDPA